jgi:hypothetical protein
VADHALLSLHLLEKVLLIKDFLVLPVALCDPLLCLLLLLPELLHPPLPDALQVIVLQVLELVQLRVYLVL